MIAYDFLNKRTEEINLPKEIANIVPPIFGDYIKTHTLNPIFVPQTLIIESLKEEKEFTFNIDISKHEYLNKEGDDELHFASLEKISRFIEIEPIWEANQIMFIGSTYRSQIYIGYGAANSDFVYIDFEYEDKFQKVANSVIAFFKNLPIIFNPIFNGDEIKLEKLQKENYWMGKLP